jgi:hypothetical protein
VNPRWLRPLLFASLFTAAGLPTAQAQDAASLKARHTALIERLASNPFGRPLHVESSERSSDLLGDAYAVIDQPFAVVGAALQAVGPWCDILMLHLNVKGCRTAPSPAGDTITLNVGRKTEQPVDDAYRFEFHYRLVSSRPDYLQVALNAEDGPMGTSHYRILLEVAALDAKRSFLHLSYAYAYGVSASLAMKGYLATTGRDKLGFSVVGTRPDGKPEHIRGTRGVIERNTVRYHLAIEAYLSTLSTPATQQPDKRLNAWFSAVERHPLQLHELERQEYLDMKRREIRRQLAPSSSNG